MCSEYLPLQGNKLQISICSFVPRQNMRVVELSPHDLELNLTPPPQVFEQSSQLSQLDHAPS